MAIVNELVTLLDMELGDNARKAVDFVDKSISAIADNMEKLGKTATAMVAGIGASMNIFGKDAKEINELANETGNSVSDIQSLGYAFESMGASADDARGVLKSLNDSMYSVTQGEANEALLRMGITIFDNNNKLKNSSQLFMEISDKLSTMASKGGVYARDAAKWGKELGLSGEALQVALQGTNKIRGLQKEAQSLGLVFSKDKLVAGKSFYESFNKIKNIVKGLYMTVMADLAPELNKLAQNFQDWMKNSDNSKKVLYGLNLIIKGVVGGFIKFSSVITKIAGFIDDLISKFGPFGTELKNIEKISNLVAVAIGVMVGSFVLAPILSFTKHIILLGTTLYTNRTLILSLAKAMVQYGASIGFKLVGLLASFITSIVSSTTALWGFVVAQKAMLFEVTLVIMAIAALVAAGVWLYKNWDKVSQFFKRTWESIKNTAVEFTNSAVDGIMSAWNGVKLFFENLWGGICDIFKSGLDYVQPIIDKVMGFANMFGSGLSWVKNKIGWGDNTATKQIAELASIPQQNSNTVNNISNNSQNNPTDVTNNTTFNINVSGGSDPAKTARAIRGAMESYANEVNGG